MALIGASSPGAGTPRGPVAPLRGSDVPRQSRVHAALAAYEHQWLLYRRTWRGSIFGSFAQPVLFLVAMGIGLGAYVNKANPASLEGYSYLQFLAPALLVSSAMQSSVFEATFPVLAGFRWIRRYHAQFATPLTPGAIAFGQIAWIATRATLVGTIFTLVIFAFHAAPTAGIILAIPVGTLTALAFAAPIAAYMSTQRDTQAFNAIWRFGITPLFLFSGTFFPIDQLPAQVQWIAWLLPLWHGVNLARSLSLGIVWEDPLLAVVHIVVLGSLAIGGLIAMYVMFHRQLER
jgi:lipooligosaccharide transport system permease protein